MKFFGTVFTENGKTFAWCSREAPPSTAEHPFELRADGIVIPADGGEELIDWEVVEDLRGWSLDAEELRR